MGILKQQPEEQSANKRSPTNISGRELKKYRRVIIKVGSALLVDRESKTLREEWLTSLAQDISEMRNRGVETLIVSSGSIALGRRLLDLPQQDLSLSDSQAAAAAGQVRLAHAYSLALAPHGFIAAQILLTLEDTASRRRYLNGSDTLRSLLKMGAIPVVNENDTVATDEIRYGDNDRLAARVAMMVSADLLILLSDVDGLYNFDPRLDKSAKRIPLIDNITPEIEAMAGDEGISDARGGMKTKIEAARVATRSGCVVAIAPGTDNHPVRGLFAGGNCSIFTASDSPARARKNWIAGMKPSGRLVIDDGAAAALRKGRSLLPAGVREVLGNFSRGDPVIIETQSGDRVAIALIGYDSDEASKVMGLHSAQVAKKLGYDRRAALAHRDNMMVWV